MLEHDHPLAATILYRALLDDILINTRSKAYSHGAKYLEKLTLLALEADPGRPNGMADHGAYFVKLKETHLRKSSFWSRVENIQSTPPQSRITCRPDWSKNEK